MRVLALLLGCGVVGVACWHGPQVDPGPELRALRTGGESDEPSGRDPAPPTGSADVRSEAPTTTGSPPASSTSAPGPRASSSSRRSRAEYDELAHRLGSPAQCETAARDLAALEGTDEGWKLLVACSRQPGFHHLRRLLHAPWVSELRTRPDAAPLLARVIAARGGDVRADLKLLQSRRVPLFSLRAALSRPETYQGRLLLVRGRALDEQDLGTAAALIEETEVVAELHERRGAVTRWTHIRTPDPRLVGGTSGVHEVQSPYDLDAEHVDVGTGRRLVARLPRQDPFLEPGEPYLFVVRFEGVRPLAAPDDDVVDEQPVGELVTWVSAPTRSLE